VAGKGFSLLNPGPFPDGACGTCLSGAVPRGPVRFARHACRGEDVRAASCGTSRGKRMAAIPARSRIGHVRQLLLGSEAAILLQRGEAIGVAFPPPFLGVSSLDLGRSGNVSGLFLFNNHLKQHAFHGPRLSPADQSPRVAAPRRCVRHVTQPPRGLPSGEEANLARFSSFEPLRARSQFRLARLFPCSLCAAQICILQCGTAIGVALPPPSLGVSSLDLGCSRIARAALFLFRATSIAAGGSLGGKAGPLAGRPVSDIPQRRCPAGIRLTRKKAGDRAHGVESRRKQKRSTAGLWKHGVQPCA